LSIVSVVFCHGKLSETCRASYRNKEIVKRCILLVVLCGYTSDARTCEC